MDLPRFEPSVDDATLAAALDEAGGCVIEEAADPATMDAIAAELAPFARPSIVHVRVSIELPSEPSGARR